ISAVQQITASGTYLFDNGGVTLQTSASGLTPAGETWLSRIHQQPNEIPNASTGPFYWILENFASNQVFDTLQSLQFQNTGFSLPSCSEYTLYRRDARSDAPSWGSALDNADDCSFSVNQNSITFNEGNSVTQGGQWVLASTGSLPLNAPLIQTLVEGIHLAPNPVNEESELRLFSAEKDLKVELFDSFGRQVAVWTLCNNGQTLQLGKLASGTYYARFSNSKGMWLQRLVVM
ncbi:MAG: T9SS type A sorting domain-containing protein, partial [Bacteroidia bacterium]